MVRRDRFPKNVGRFWGARPLVYLVRSKCSATPASEPSFHLCIIIMYRFRSKLAFLMFANTGHGDIEPFLVNFDKALTAFLSSRKTNGMGKKRQEHFCSHPGWSVKVYHSKVSKSTHQPPDSEASNSFWFLPQHAFLGPFKFKHGAR